MTTETILSRRVAACLFLATYFGTLLLIGASGFAEGCPLQGGNAGLILFIAAWQIALFPCGLIGFWTNPKSDITGGEYLYYAVVGYIVYGCILFLMLRFRRLLPIVCCLVGFGALLTINIKGCDVVAERIDRTLPMYIK